MKACVGLSTEEEREQVERLRWPSRGYLQELSEYQQRRRKLRKSRCALMWANATWMTGQWEGTGESNGETQEPTMETPKEEGSFLKDTVEMRLRLLGVTTSDAGALVLQGGKTASPFFNGEKCNYQISKWCEWSSKDEQGELVTSRWGSGWFDKWNDLEWLDFCGSVCTFYTLDPSFETLTDWRRCLLDSYWLNVRINDTPGNLHQKKTKKTLYIFTFHFQSDLFPLQGNKKLWFR